MILIGIAVASSVPAATWAVTVGGDLIYTTDYLFRGVSESGGRGAGQLDLHVMTAGGSFAGVFASTLEAVSSPAPHYETEVYLGHRFALSPTWSTTLAAVHYDYLHGSQPLSNDYEELSAAVSYLDLWTISFATAPNVVRYLSGYRLGRYSSYVLDGSAQLPLIGRLFATAGLGYEVLEGPAGTGYAFGNVGLAVEYQSWRLDGGYYFTEAHAVKLYPYERVANRFVVTLSWHF